MMYEDEPINEYRIKVTVRNNLILNAIEAAGYKNVSEFCHAVDIHKTALTELVAMRKAPLNLDGEFSACAKALMEGLCALPTDLWTSEQLTLKLKRNSAEREVSAEGMRAALGMNAEETLELMKPDDLEETVLKKEMVSVIEEQLNSLGPRESKVLRLRFGIDCEEQTLEQIADTLDVTKERIRQIEAKALRHLKHPSRSDTLRQLLPDYEIPKPKQKAKELVCGIDRGHMFYINQNQVNVCAHCGVSEERLNTIKALAQLRKKETANER
jgi:RNA polymerase sigma factor (sigma-70 family)